MGMAVASEAARGGCAVVGDRGTCIGTHNNRVKVHHALARNVCRFCGHAVRSMTGGTRESVIDVPGVFAEARI